MREVNRLLDNVVIPKMVRVQQTFEHEHIAREMIGSVISDILSEEKLESQIQPGMRIALPAGSREICNMDEILASVVQALKKKAHTRLLFRLWEVMAAQQPKGKGNSCADIPLRKKDVGVLSCLLWRRY